MGYALGGSQSGGFINSIERFNGEAWEEFTVSQGYRMDFCSIQWGEDGIVMIGGFDDLSSQRQVDLFNITTGSWNKLGMLNTGRDFSGCTEYNGGIMVGGGWVYNDDPQWPCPCQEVSRTTEWYDPITDSWSQAGLMAAKRSKFAMETINGTLVALGGFDGVYKDTLERYEDGDGGWHAYEDSFLAEPKAAFGVVKIPDNLLEDMSCLT